MTHIRLPQINGLTEDDMQRGTSRQWIADEVARADHSSGPWKHPVRATQANPPLWRIWAAKMVLGLACAAIWMGAGAILALWLS